MIVLDNVRVSTVTKLLLLLVVALTFISFILGAYALSQGITDGLFDKLFKLFNVDFERNVPTWFASMGLGLVGFHFLLVSYYRHLLQKDFVLHWFFLGLIFMAISMDEFGQLHEQIIRPLRDSFNTSGFLYYPWILPAGILTVIVGGIYYVFIQELLWETKLAFILAGLFYVGGALGVEAIGGYYFDNYIRPYGTSYNLVYLFITHLEELFEMIGTVLFLYVGMRYVQMMGLSKLEDSND
jgi:hypothetical protein